jgi:precorrin-8X/cobalt-precorrin-8 methylmutase
MSEARTPEEIFRESFRIIDAEAGTHGFAAREWEVVRRMIHASGDLDIARAVHLQHNPIASGLAALRSGVPIVTDVRMVAAGLKQDALRELGIAVHCFIDDPEVARAATARRRTRSYCAMEMATRRVGEAIYAIGNAPTAIFALADALRGGAPRPRLLLAIPVGFVDVIESKELALSLGLPTIMVRGRKGGSAMTAAALNALLLLALEELHR